ncbi:MAG: hypothetical protein KGO49_11380 [Gammaproteobacteria bacterium]|nr:hypothetical protein [Gammaproteobacteria bacterium]
MNKKLLLLTVTLLVSFFARSAELSDVDSGIYEVLNPKNEATGVLYKLSKTNTGWSAFGKLPNNNLWKDLSCDAGCAYRTSTDTDVNGFFPADWLARFDIACIQDIAQAFCRVSPKGDPSKNIHMIIALVTGKPIPLYLKRRIDLD